MNNDDKSLLEEIYKNAQMNIQALNTVRKSTLNENLKGKIDNQIVAYEDYKQKAQNLLRQSGAKEKEVDIITSSVSKIGINISSSVNPETENIIGMLIKGTQKGTENLAVGMNEFSGSDPKVMQIASDLMNFEKNNISAYNDFL